MIDTYEEYLDAPRALTMEQMEALHREMTEEIGKDSEAEEIYEELIDKAVEYVQFRAEWKHMSREEKMDRDPSRTAKHDSLIVHFNMLARYLKIQGKAAAWRDALGDEKEDGYIRKRIGDFACYLVFIQAVNAR